MRSDGRGYAYAMRTVPVAAVLMLVTALGNARSRPGLGQALGAPMTTYAYSYLYPSFGFGPYGHFFAPFPSYPIVASPYPYMPNYWWVSAYPLDASNQPGYNPSAGYEWERVTTLLLTASPSKARVTLNGVFVGTADSLGPIQLPIGEHSLQVEAPGYEPCQTALKIQGPSVRQLDIRLTPADPNRRPRIAL